MKAPDLGLVLSPDRTSVLVDGFKSHNVARFNLADGLPKPAPGQTGANFVPSGSGSLDGTEGLDFGPDGNLYVTDQLTTVLRGRIQAFSGTDGSPLGIFVNYYSGGIQNPAGLLFYDDGTGPGTAHHRAAAGAKVCRRSTAKRYGLR
jgi:hypothetical protein